MNVIPESCCAYSINVREHRNGNQNGQSRETNNTRYTRRRQAKQKHNTICGGHHYTQTDTNNVNSVCTFLLQQFQRIISCKMKCSTLSILSSFTSMEILSTRPSRAHLWLTRSIVCKLICVVNIMEISLT